MLVGIAMGASVPKAARIATIVKTFICLLSLNQVAYKLVGYVCTGPKKVSYACRNQISMGLDKHDIPVGSRYTGPDSCIHLKRALNKAPPSRSLMSSGFASATGVSCIIQGKESSRAMYSESRTKRKVLASEREPLSSKAARIDSI